MADLTIHDPAYWDDGTSRDRSDEIRAAVAHERANAAVDEVSRLLATIEAIGFVLDPEDGARLASLKLVTLDKDQCDQIVRLINGALSPEETTSAV